MNYRGSKNSKPHVFIFVAGWFCAAIQVVEAEPAKIDFGRDVWPILARCVKCHGPEKQQGALRFDVRSGALRAGDSGSEAVVAGDAARSELIRRIESKDDSERMPSEGEPLSREQIKILRAWIDQGAHWPETSEAAAAERGELVVTEVDRQHWSYRPLREVEPPAIKDDDWCATPIDRFVLAALEARSLRPSKPADRSRLIRRVYFDLIGLPPSPEQVEAFVAKRVLSVGGRFTFDDDGQTPNTQLALFQYDPGPLVVFELRNLPSDKGPQTINKKVKCERGEAALPNPTGKPGDTGGFTAHKGHLYNFISAVRSRNVSDLRADILEGHLSTALVHMANASHRVGTSHSADEVRDAIKDQGSEALETFGRFHEHLLANGVDFSKSQFTLGPWLEIDAEREQFVGAGDLVSRANQLLRGSYRQPFAVPEQV